MFERIRYPDGQIGAKFVKETNNQLHNFTNTINERINSYEDLFYIRSIADILTHNNTQNWGLYIPCMFGQRSDKRFTESQSFDLKLIADIINQCNFKSVSIFDPHSDITLALINNSVKISSFEYVKKTIEDIEKDIPSETVPILVSPDAGAYKKVFEYGEKLNLPVVAAVKHRDLEGKIDLTFMGDVKDKDCLIVDDLCSRGGTFIKLTEKLREQGARKVYLYISHFEGGCEEYKQTILNLRKSIDWIYTTNSFREFDEEDNKNLTIYKII